MSVYTHDDIQNAVKELETKGLGDFLYKEPTGRKNRSDHKSRSHRTSRTGRTRRTSCFRPYRKQRYWYNGNMWMLRLELNDI
jgi:hypothetical protein